MSFRPNAHGRAFLWSAIESISRQLLSVGLSFAVIALITPHDLGIYSLTFSIIIVLGLVVDDPICEALLRRQDADDKDWNTGFTVNLSLASLAFFLCFLISSRLSGLFGEETLKFTVPILGSCIFIGSLGNIQKAYLARGLQFRAVARISLLSNTVGGLSALLLALRGYGYWAMIMSQIVSTVTGTTSYWVYSKWKPKILIRKESIRSLANFAGKSFFIYAVLLLREGALPLLIGKLNGSIVLGFFTLAFRISRTVGLLFEEMVRRPLFTIVSQIAGETSRTASFMLNIMTIVGAAAIPTFVGVAMLGPGLTTLIFGEKWTQSNSLLPLICAVVFGWFSLHIPTVTMRALGYVTSAVGLLGASGILDLAIASLLLPYGLKVALIGMVVRAIVFLPLLDWLMKRTLTTSLLQIFDRWKLPLLGALLMGGSITFVQPILGEGWLSLVGETLIAVVTYIASLIFGRLLGDRHLEHSLAQFS